ncbi:phosphoglucan, water dikinase [Ranunculus cassubicifolius]
MFLNFCPFFYHLASLAHMELTHLYCTAEVTASGNNIVGIGLLQVLPGLSHLGVKARQATELSLLLEIKQLTLPHENWGI